MSRAGKIAVIGAGFYGSTTAMRLAEYDIFETVVLTDVLEGKAEGLALDMNQSRPVQKFETQIIGQTTGLDGSGYEAISGSKIVVITAGLPRKPGMSRMDLIETNAKIVRQVSENVAKHAKDAVVIVVSNPLDEMTALAQIATGFPKNRVMGQAGMLDTARFTNFVAELYFERRAILFCVAPCSHCVDHFMKAVTTCIIGSIVPCSTRKILKSKL